MKSFLYSTRCLYCFLANNQWWTQIFLSTVSYILLQTTTSEAVPKDKKETDIKVIYSLRKEIIWSHCKIFPECDGDMCMDRGALLRKSVRADQISNSFNNL